VKVLQGIGKFCYWVSKKLFMHN